MTSSASLRRTLSNESSKLRKEVKTDPESIVETEPTPTSIQRLLTPLSKRAVRVEPAALIKSKGEPRRSTPLDRYWNEDRRKRMFRAEPIPEPTKPKSIESPYERKFVKTRPSTPIKDEPTPPLVATPKPEPQGQFKTTPTPVRHHCEDLKRSPSLSPPRGPSPPRSLTPPSPPSRGPSPGPPLQQLNPIQGDVEPLQGKEPPVFEGDRQKTDHFLHELRLYQFVNATHPVMVNPWQKVAHALTYVNGPNVYEWKQSAEYWILSIPAPSAPNRTIYDDFEEEFVKSWTDTNEPYRAATELDKLQMQYDNIDEYIARFAELARKALYHENDPAVLEKFKSGLPLELLEPCMQHDDPQNWEAWTKSARARQAILTSLKAHRIDMTRQPLSPIKECTPTPPSTPPLVPMEIDKLYMIPAQRRSPNPKDDERRKGLCHLCKRHGHIQRYCPKKILEQPAHMANTRTVPLVTDQGIKRPRSPTIDSGEVLRYLKKATPESRDKVAADLMKPTSRQDFFLA